MNARLIEWAMERDLKPSAKLFLLTLCYRAVDREGCEPWFDPKIDEMAKWCGVTRMTVFVTIRTLEKAGLIRVQRYPGERNVYVLLADEVAKP